MCLKSIAAILGVFMGAGMMGQSPAAARYQLASPDGGITIDIQMAAGNPQWSAECHGKPILNHCRLSLEGLSLGDLMLGAHVRGTHTRSHDERVRVMFGKAEFARDKYNELRLALENALGWRTSVVFRCYDDAIAFRYEIPKQTGLEQLVVSNEGTSFGVVGNPTAYVQYLAHYKTSHEHNVSTALLSDIKRDTLLDMPLTLAWEDGKHIAITEAALRKYAGMSLMRTPTTNELVCKLTPRSDGTKVLGPLPAKTPWRVVLVGNRVGALLESNVIYCLNEPSAIKDTSWIKPGKMTWSWWNGNLFNAKPSASILSLAMAKKYIDFCARNGIAFHSVIADETDTPWYYQTKKGLFPDKNTDVTKVREDLDLARIKLYAASKGVRLWTWVHQGALRGRVEEAFAAFERLGWNGIMVDFFDHDDQESVELSEEILQAAARHHILIHFHGIWKPTGMQRTYPNLMNHEGALNLECLKWGATCTPEHSLLLAFTRLVAGPMDYHLGGFRATTPRDFEPHNVGPNVLGTRCQMLAMYVCFDNPNPMVADYPAAYEGQVGFEFLTVVPTWWDETRALMAEEGRLLVTARRRGKTWYVGGMSAGPPREIEIPLSFLGNGTFRMTLWQDGAKAEADPNDISSAPREVTRAQTFSVSLATDGGFVAVLAPK